jgi:hypothetical protein
VVVGCGVVGWWNGEMVGLLNLRAIDLTFRYVRID